MGVTPRTLVNSMLGQEETQELGKRTKGSRLEYGPWWTDSVLFITGISDE